MPGQVRPVADEREALLAFLNHQRYVLRIAAHGLTDEQARLSPTRSALSVGGLLKHCLDTERSWMDLVLQRPVESEVDDRARNYLDNFHLREDETVAAVIESYEEVAADTRRVVADIVDLGQAVPVPKGVPWFPQDLDAWSVRWVLLHLIAETARHAGHADIIRESIDGATAFPLMAAVEGWPETSWMRPWRLGAS